MLNHNCAGPNHSFTCSLITGSPAGSLVLVRLSLQLPPSYSALCSWWAAAGHWPVSPRCWTSPSPPACPWHAEEKPHLMAKGRMIRLNRDGKRRRNRRKRQTRKRRKDPKEPPRPGKWSCRSSSLSHRGRMWCRTCLGWPGRNQVGSCEKKKNLYYYLYVLFTSYLQGCLVVFGGVFVEVSSEFSTHENTIYPFFFKIIIRTSDICRFPWSVIVLKWCVCALDLVWLILSLVFRSQAPGEVMSSYRQSPVLRQGNHTIQDLVGFPVGLWNLPKEIGGIEFWPVNRHPASLGHHSTWMRHTNASVGPFELIVSLVQ